MGTTTSRLFLPYPVAADNNDVPTHMGSLAQDIDDKLCQVLTLAGRGALTARQGMRVWTSDGGGTSVPTESFRDASAWLNISRYSQGTLAARPAANTVLPGHQYWATDVYNLYISDASNWYRVGTPAGVVQDFLGDEGGIPVGYIVLLGQTVSRTGIYADLFAAWSTKYGAGDGSTTFKLPDTRGVVFADIDTHTASQISDVTQRIGAASGTRHASGEISHTLITAEIPSHAHNFTWYWAPSGAPAASGGFDCLTYPQGTAGGATASAGGGGSHNNIQPTMTTVKIAKL